MKTTQEIAQDIAKRAQEKRLRLNISQQTLSNRSGVSFGSLKKFEQTGQVSLKSLLKIALILDSLDEFERLFALEKPEEALSLDALMQDKFRKRGRK